jgi:hypothetical protein
VGARLKTLVYELKLECCAATDLIFDRSRDPPMNIEIGTLKISAARRDKPMMIVRRIFSFSA